MTNPRFVEFFSTDGVGLPGLLFEPSESSDAVALYLHGNGSCSVFYAVENMHAMAERLLGAGIAFFPFNNRGAHVIHKLNRTLPDGTVRREQHGTAYELIKDCVHDIDGALTYLRGLGYEKFYLLGESTGANKICVYDRYKPNNNFLKYVLVSGGDDSGIYYQELGKELFAEVLATARHEVEQGRGRGIVDSQIVQITGLLSQQSILDMLDPDGDYNTFPFNDAMNHLRLSRKPLFGYYNKVIKPHAVFYGAEDEYCYGDVPRVIGLFKANKNPHAEADFRIFPGADHGFVGKYVELAEAVADFLVK